MNETIQNILSRRSVRSFEPRQIEEEKLQAILQAGEYAPSGMNQQPWHFTVIQNAALLGDITENCKRLIKQSDDSYVKERLANIEARAGSLFHNAPTLIIVSGDEKSLSPQINCCLALENMLIAAQSLGLASCWVHAAAYLYTIAEGKAFLHAHAGIPRGYAVYCAGVFGYPAVNAPKLPPRRKDAVTYIR